MAKRQRSKTRADMIALLKSRGVRGTLSKMTKQQLWDKLDETAPPEDMEGGSAPQRSGELQLEPDPRAPRRPARRTAPRRRQPAPRARLSGGPAPARPGRDSQGRWLG